MPSDAITQQVSDRYAKAASVGEQMCCPTSYDMAQLKTFIPDEVLKISYGCGTPAGLRTVRPCETVLDIGSGGGIDCFEASRLVGQNGRVIGVDMTPEMLERARAGARLAGLSQVVFLEGLAESLPVEDGWADVVISNGVMNLFPDKMAGLQEMLRVLKPGGRLQIGDILVQKAVGEKSKRDISLWKG